MAGCRNLLKDSVVVVEAAACGKPEEDSPAGIRWGPSSWSHILPTAHSPCRLFGVQQGHQVRGPRLELVLEDDSGGLKSYGP